MARPIIVSVGPLAAAVPGGIATGQQPANGQFQLNGVGGPVITTGWTGTGAIANGVLSGVVTGAGALGAGMRLNGLGVLPNTVVTGPGPTAGTWIVSPAQTLSNGPLRGNVVVTLDAPRQVAITTSSTTGAITIQGTDGGGNPVSETLTCTGGNLVTSQNFATVTQAFVTGTMTAAAVIGTAATATSPWVRLDDWVGTYVSYQCAVVGTPNYTLQQTFDDPISPTNPVPPAAMNWVNNPNTAVVGATTTQQGAYSLAPLYVRVVLNSGAGSVTATFLQPGGPGSAGAGGGAAALGPNLTLSGNLTVGGAATLNSLTVNGRAVPSLLAGGTSAGSLQIGVTNTGAPLYLQWTFGQIIAGANSATVQTGAGFVGVNLGTKFWAFAFPSLGDTPPAPAFIVNGVGGSTVNVVTADGNNVAAAQNFQVIIFGTP